ncbi:RNA polymerase sigma-70 factor [Bacteroidota bacterium]
MGNKQKIFEEIYIRHYCKVKFFACSYLKDTSEAESVAQDVFIYLWNNWDRVQISENILSYLMVSAKRKCLNVLRKERYGRDYLEHNNRLTKEIFNYNSLEDGSSTALYSSEIEKIYSFAIDSMPEKIRTTFLLSRIKYLKYDEIATIQKISVKTVEYRITYALKILRGYLKDYLFFLLGYLFSRLF